MRSPLSKSLLTATIWGIFSMSVFGQDFLEGGQNNPIGVPENPPILTTDSTNNVGVTQNNMTIPELTPQYYSSNEMSSPDSIPDSMNGSAIMTDAMSVSQNEIMGDGFINDSNYFNGYYGVNDGYGYNEYYNSDGYNNYQMDQGLLSGYRTPGSRFFVNGWVSTGANSNSVWPITTAAGGETSDEASSFQMNQLYLSLGLDTVKANQLSIGGRVDLLYGTDYLYTSSLGLEVGTTNAAGNPVDSVYAAKPKWNRNSKGGFPQYGLAMPQAYAEVYLPVMEGLTVQMGHFYSPVGYESVMSTSNFFYTHSYTMLYGEPQTVTGLLGTQKLNANWSFLGGFSQGWNVWEDPNAKMSFIAGTKWENCCKTSSLAFTIMSGDELSEVEDSKITNYSLVYQQQLNPCLQFVLQHDMGFADNGGYGYNAEGQMERIDAKWASLVSYLYWQLTEVSTLGFRFEWFQDKNLSRVLALPAYNNMALVQNKWKGQNFYDISLGLNWKPTPWLTIRPEVRYDWSDLENVDADGNVISNGVYDDFTKKNLFTVGGDFVIRF